MDTAIANGDFKTDAKGLPVTVEGAEELLQRAMFRLTVPQGSFLYDGQLGSRLHTLKETYERPAALGETALQMAREALEPMEQVTVQSVQVERTGPDGLLLGISLLADRQQTELEVLL